MAITKIAILLSTYNGEKYIKEQIDSILNQQGVETYIFVRDDGSSDATVAILKELQVTYRNRIELTQGKNLGYAGSFISLLSKSEEKFDFYAFSDQDDVWLPEKCKRGVDALIKNRVCLGLYASAITICDENLHPVYVNHYDEKFCTLKSDFIRHRYAGCTMLFTRQLAVLARQLLNSTGYERYPFSHDFALTSIAHIVGKVVLDQESFILHRRLESSVTAREKGVLNRIKTELDGIIRRKGEASSLAGTLLALEQLGIYLSDKDKSFLNAVMSQRECLKSRLKLIADSEFSCGIRICDFITYSKILLGLY